MTLLLVKGWIGLSVLCCAGGWLLSGLRQLNRFGYVALFLAAGLGAGLYLRHGPGRLLVRGRKKHCAWRKLCSRFRRPLPLAFLVLAAAVLTSGLIYAPNNFDALTYRLPRVLHWLSAEQWHWIHTAVPRMNNRGIASEWLAVPWIALMRTDRLLFLVNFASYLLMPGLTFNTLTRLGIRSRVAWWWMWLLPSGYCFLLQAGSIGNDSLGVVYALAAVNFALRASRSRSVSEAWFSILSAALLTGCKPSNLPLLLPWAIAFAPVVLLLLKRPLTTAAVCMLAASVSFAPSAWFNLRHSGDWTGLAMESQIYGLVYRAPNALAGLAFNSAALWVSNLTPPLMPFAGAWNHHVERLLAQAPYATYASRFQRSIFKVLELQNEESAALGFGASLLLVGSCIAAWRHRSAAPSILEGGRWRRYFAFSLLVSPWVALLVLMAHSGVACLGRMISPYYPLLVALPLAGAGHAYLVRRRCWQRLALAVMVLAGVVLLLTPSRPLWPARTLFSLLQTRLPGNRLVQRAREVHEVYAARSDALGPLRALIPEHAQIVGFVASFDDPETSLWRPFGSRRVEHVLADDSPEEVCRKGIEYVIVSPNALLTGTNASVTNWLALYRAQLIGSAPIAIKASQGVQEWYVARIRCSVIR